MSGFEHADTEGMQLLWRAIEDDDVDRLRTLIVGAALHEANFDAVYEACVELSRHTDDEVRGNAVLGFGHLARRFGRLGDEAPAIVRAAMTDPSWHVRGQAHAAAMDLRDFL